jgi:hypothetical protein
MAEAEAAPAMAARRVIIPHDGKCKAEIVWAMIQTDKSSDFVMVVVDFRFSFSFFCF